ncbi:type II toxin-antitoxin system prevent-host-death family antitoxin [Lichenibacterium ramalinae]|uniref:Antitoxin n=2 Tax=Lichenibacterium ramalinae TaxID=2316527 RepID=A0A4Q2RAU1_9HYPH|nr:type II toxin-antitoxin system prevent-host-death family antitoxin [Lichenibacterium ramalinae]RYB03474.1 type II toxin-antitoxin system prevent-host-death family antitoxin [Lichenibacterium ramalinae]
MRTMSFSEVRRNLAQTIDSVNADHEPVMVTRDRGKPAAVLISVEDFASFEETAYLLRSPKNADRLARSIENLERGLGTEREIID